MTVMILIKGILAVSGIVSLTLILLYILVAAKYQTLFNPF